MGDNGGSKVSYFLVGLGMGALLGVLFAPKSGEETREYLKDKAEEGREYAQKKARELRERAEEMGDRARDTVSRQKDHITSAIEAGTDAYQRAKKAH